MISDFVMSCVIFLQGAFFLIHHLQVAEVFKILLHRALFSGESHKVLAVHVNLVKSLVQEVDFFFKTH